MDEELREHLRDMAKGIREDISELHSKLDTSHDSNLRDHAAIEIRAREEIERVRLEARKGIEIHTEKYHFREGSRMLDNAGKILQIIIASVVIIGAIAAAILLK